MKLHRLIDEPNLNISERNLAYICLFVTREDLARNGKFLIIWENLDSDIATLDGRYVKESLKALKSNTHSFTPILSSEIQDKAELQCILSICAGFCLLEEIKDGKPTKEFVELFNQYFNETPLEDLVNRIREIHAKR